MERDHVPATFDLRAEHKELMPNHWFVVVSLRNCWGVWQILRRRFSEGFEWGGLRSRQRIVPWRAASMLPHLLQEDWREQLVDSHPAWYWSRLRERHCRPFTGKLWCWHCWIRTNGLMLLNWSWRWLQVQQLLQPRGHIPLLQRKVRSQVPMPMRMQDKQPQTTRARSNGVAGEAAEQQLRSFQRFQKIQVPRQYCLIPSFGFYFTHMLYHRWSYILRHDN